jgi:hypothetical protein
MNRNPNDLHRFNISRGQKIKLTIGVQPPDEQGRLGLTIQTAVDEDQHTTTDTPPAPPAPASTRNNNVTASESSPPMMTTSMPCRLTGANGNADSETNPFVTPEPQPNPAMEARVWRRSLLPIWIKNNALPENSLAIRDFYKMHKNPPQGRRYTAPFPIIADYPHKEIVKQLGAQWNPYLKTWYVDPLVKIDNFLERWVSEDMLKLMRSYEFHPDPAAFNRGDGDEYNRDGPTSATKEDDESDGNDDNNSDGYGSTYQNLDTDMVQEENDRLTSDYLLRNTYTCPNDECGAKIQLENKNGHSIKVRCPRCEVAFCKECMGKWVGLHDSTTGGLATCNRVAKMPDADEHSLASGSSDNSGDSMVSHNLLRTIKYQIHTEYYLTKPNSQLSTTNIHRKRNVRMPNGPVRSRKFQMQ